MNIIFIAYCYFDIITHPQTIIFAYATTKKGLPKTTTLKSHILFQRTALPDYHALVLGQEHSARGNIERLVEGVDIAQGDVHAVAAE